MKKLIIPVVLSPPFFLTLPVFSALSPILKNKALRTDASVIHDNLFKATYDAPRHKWSHGHY